MDARPSSPREIPWAWREWVCAVALIGGMVAFLALYGPRLREESAPFLWDMGMLLALLTLPELARYALMRSFGARPKAGWKWSAAPRPALVSLWTAEGHGFTAVQYAAVGSVPVLATLAAGSVYVSVAPTETAGVYFLVVYALAIRESLWLSLIALRQPEGTLFEERATGTHLSRPLPDKA